MEGRFIDNCIYYEEIICPWVMDYRGSLIYLHSNPNDFFKNCLEKLWNVFLIEGSFFKKEELYANIIRNLETRRSLLFDYFSWKIYTFFYKNYKKAKFVKWPSIFEQGYLKKKVSTTSWMLLAIYRWVISVTK